MEVERLTSENVLMETDGTFINCPNCDCTPEIAIVIGDGACHCCGQKLAALLLWPEEDGADEADDRPASMTIKGP